MNGKKTSLLGLFFIVLCGFSLLYPRSLAESADLVSAKDTLDTSRSSWLTTLATASNASDTNFHLTSIAGILPGDTIKFWGGTAEVLIIATIDSSGSRVTTTSGAAYGHSQSTNVSGGFGYDPSTDVGGTIAYHLVTFTPTTSAIDGGEVRITFPVNASTPNDGSPDSDGFDFNSIAGSDISCTGGGSNANWGSEDAATAAAGTIVFPFRDTLEDEAVTCAIGSATRATGAHLINPYKTASSGTADTWTVSVQTLSHPNYSEVDAVDLKIATVESIRVTATVSPTLTMIIAGTANATSVCGETTNSGTASTAVLVPLGTLSDSALNVNAQNIKIATNAKNGYTLLERDDGYLRKSNGDNINYHNTAMTDNDAPTPTVMNTAGTESYGIHACGSHVNTTTWGDGAGATTNYYGGPGSGTAWQYYRTIVSYTAPTAQTITNVVYKATISGLTPAGDYSQAITYTATGNF